MVSSSPKASSKEMEGNALIGLPEKIYKTLDESTKILRFKVSFPMFAYPIYLDSKGKEVDLSTYKGKVLLVVNVASKCGLADSNYTQLIEVYNKYKEKEVGRIGIGICYDIRFQELAMLYAARGAHLICYPGAFNMTTGPLHWELLQRARSP